jgi:hypothetical protein
LEAKQEIHRFNSRLDGLSKQVEGVADAIDEIQRYSYQYNVKILGILETKQDKTSFDTITLCVGLFKGMGVDINHSLTRSRLFANLCEEFQRSVL